MHSLDSETIRELSSIGEVRVLYSDTIVVRVGYEKLREATRRLHVLGYRYSTSVGVDYRPIDNTYKIYHIFSHDSTGIYILIEVSVSQGDLRVPSITPTIPAANWAERELHDMLGIEFEDHPELERLVLPSTWPRGVYPLRKDFPYSEKYIPKEIEEEYLRTELESYRRYTTIPLGPYHPALHEPEYFELYIDGERIVDIRYRGFMIHRGIEKIAEAKLTLNQIPFIAERICGICGFTHSTAYCQAVEKILGIEIPDRAKYIRSILLEIERIHSHLLWFGVLLHLLGFDIGFMAMWRIREKVMDLAEILTGNRKTYGLNIVGGVRRDIDEDKKPVIFNTLKEVEKLFRDYVEKVFQLKEIRARTKEIGILTRSDAKKLGVVGPTARGSGIDIDVRRDHPYAAYRYIEFKVPVYDEGDVYSRVMVRYEEVLESIKMIEQLVKDMPKTSIVVEEYEFKPLGMGIGYTEAPRGENMHFVILGKDNKVYRWKVRSPTYNNIPSLYIMLK
ncbi:MAG TPA: hydrogenase large subunit, partial [Ignisphaera sp.]|nr:hydrogenase large subunit [Ignisphaera sp.]